MLKSYFSFSSKYRPAYCYTVLYCIFVNYYNIVIIIIYRTLGLTFMKMFQPKRPLRPKRKERKKIPAKSLSGQEIKVNSINIVDF